MTQSERRRWLIRALQKETPRYAALSIPAEPEEQRRLLRALFNLRMPNPVSEQFLAVQDAYLQEVIRQKGITDLADLHPIQPGLYLWQGDITTLRCDAIVNAANSGMLGCFVPCHGCIDNAIHTYAGVQLRLECAGQMAAQRTDEPAGHAKITGAYNLLCRRILHTVGPIISGEVTESDRALLAECYNSCLDLAERCGLHSVAFCCISTGEFHFPPLLAAQIAVDTVRGWQRNHPDKVEVIFNVFRDRDREIYRRILAAD